MGTLSREATLPVSLFSPYLMGVDSLWYIPFGKSLDLQESKHEVTKNVRLFKNERITCTCSIYIEINECVSSGCAILKQHTCNIDAMSLI